jgi:uncharacterized protein YcfJ
MMTPRKLACGLLPAACLVLTACAPAATPEAQAARDHELSCMAGSVGGALVGAAIGSAFGGGLGRDILIGAGGGAGASAGRRLACGE